MVKSRASKTARDRMRLVEVEDGFGTASVALAILASALVTVGMLQMFYTAWERMEVRNAADLSAVSGAIVLRDTGSSSQACAQAADVAAGMNVSCTTDGEMVTVVVEKTPQFSWVTRNHMAKAVAGPADFAPG